VRIIRLFRMQGLIDAAQERAALDQVGAPDEKVLPSRRQEPAQPAAIPAGGGPPAQAEPAAPAPTQPAQPAPAQPEQPTQPEPGPPARPD
jgi:hypothetical protein